MSPLSAETAFVEGNAFDARIFTSLILVAALILFARAQRIKAILRANGWLLVFLLYCGASSIWSDYSTVAIKRWVKELGDVIMVLIVATDPSPVSALKRLLARTGFVLVPVSILLIRYYPALGRTYDAWTGAAYNIGVATGKNGLGYVCLIFGLASVWYISEAFRSGKERRLRLPLFAQCGLLALTLWLFRMAHSATSFVCFLLGSALILVLGWDFIRRPPLVHAIVVGVIFVVVYATFLNPEAGLLDAVGRDSTLTGRTRIWDAALRNRGSALVGVGYESFWLGQRLSRIWNLGWGEPPNQAHNGYLEVFLDLGIAGLAILAALIVRGYQDVIRWLRLNPEVGRIRLAFFVVAVVYNLTEHAFRELHPVWIGFLFAVTVIPETTRSLAATRIIPVVTKVRRGVA